MEPICPICGSNKFKDITKTETVNTIYGNSVTIQKKLSKCEVCEEISLFEEKNLVEENKILIETAKKDSINQMIDYLSAHSINMAYFERSLQLPQRTLIRWKKNGCSASSLALLRIVRTYPWVLNVADENFAENIAKKELVNQAFQVFLEMKNENTVVAMEKIENGIRATIVQNNLSSIQQPISTGSEVSSINNYLINVEKLNLKGDKIEAH